MNEIRTVDAVRYVLPLREGGSLPALVDADDGFKYVLKFRGGGHGAKALIAEFIGGEIARAPASPPTSTQPSPASSPNWYRNQHCPSIPTRQMLLSGIFTSLSLPFPPFFSDVGKKYAGEWGRVDFFL